MRSKRVFLLVNFGIIYFVWGMTYIWMKTANSDLHPFVVNFWQNLLAAMALLLFNFNKSFISFFKENFFAIISQSFLMLILGVSFITISVRELPASFAAVVISSVPVWVALYNALAEKYISVKNLVGLILGLVGIGFLVKLELSDYRSSSSFIILLIAALSWSYGLYRMPKLKIVTQPYLSSAAQMFIAAAAYFIISLATPAVTNLIPFKLPTISSLLCLAILGSTIAFSSLNWLLKHTSPLKVATYAYINPIVSILMAWLLLGEELRTSQLPFISMTLLSVFIVVSDGKRPKDESN